MPSVFAAYPNTLLATSFSKDLSIPGERLGSCGGEPPGHTGPGELEGALVLANRILGFVNAPALMQRVVAALTDVSLDITPYARRRELFCEVLTEAGYKFLQPQGAFYLFPRSPGEMTWRPCPASRRRKYSGGAGAGLRAGRLFPPGLLRLGNGHPGRGPGVCPGPEKDGGVGASRGEVAGGGGPPAMPSPDSRAV